MTAAQWLTTVVAVSSGGAIITITLGWEACIGVYLLMWANNRYSATLYKTKE